MHVLIEWGHLKGADVQSMLKKKTTHQINQKKEKEI